jgi:hypothetical protein
MLIFYKYSTFHQTQFYLLQALETERMKMNFE